MHPKQIGTTVSLYITALCATAAAQPGQDDAVQQAPAASHAPEQPVDERDGSEAPAENPETSPAVAAASADESAETSSAPRPVEAAPSQAPASSATDTQAMNAARAVMPEPEPVEEDSLFDSLKVRVRARVMTGFEYEHRYPTGLQTDSPVTAGDGRDRQRFFLEQARVQVKSRFNKVLTSNISVEFSNAIDNNPVDRTAYLANAWLNAELAEAVQFRLGNFKRPFSRLELTSPAELPVRGRGLTNSLVIEDLAWGQRALGAMYWGRTEGRLLRWYLSATTPNPPTEPDATFGELDGVDVHARVDVRPWKAVSIAVNGALKNTGDPLGTDDRTTLGAFGGDVRVKYKRARLVIDGFAGQSVRDPDHAFAGGVAGYATYSFKLPKHFQLQPVAFGEWSDGNLDVQGSESLRFVLGVNVLWTDYFRLMPQVEILHPVGALGVTDSNGTTTISNFQLAQETYYVMLSAQY